MEPKQGKNKFFRWRELLRLVTVLNDKELSLAKQSTNQNWQESRKKQSLLAIYQEVRKAAAQSQDSLEGGVSLHAPAGSFISLLTVCLPLHDAVWHLSGSDPYNILRCWERCCLYQSAEQPWADCSASPSLIQVAPAGSAAEKYHQRKGVHHMCWDQNSPKLLLPPLHRLQKHAVLTIWSVKICRSAGAPCKGKKRLPVRASLAGQNKPG